MKKSFLLLLFCTEAFALHMSSSWRIVGGYTAQEGQFPYQIALKLNGSLSCGGSILSPTTILNAAHCVDGMQPSVLTITAGIININHVGQTVKVYNYLKHDSYNPYNLENDISLIYLASFLGFNSKVQPIVCSRSIVTPNSNVILSGWGFTGYPTGSNAQNLQYINLISISNDLCKTYKPIGDGHICTLAPSGKGACQGDSGGPLVFGTDQVGIVSWGEPCAKGQPDIFTRVSYYIDWIDAHKNLILVVG